MKYDYVLGNMSLKMIVNFFLIIFMWYIILVFNWYLLRKIKKSKSFVIFVFVIKLFDDIEYWVGVVYIITFIIN